MAWTKFEIEEVLMYFFVRLPVHVINFDNVTEVKKIYIKWNPFQYIFQNNKFANNGLTWYFQDVILLNTTTKLSDSFFYSAQVSVYSLDFMPMDMMGI